MNELKEKLLNLTLEDLSNMKELVACLIHEKIGENDSEDIEYICGAIAEVIIQPQYDIKRMF